MGWKAHKSLNGDLFRNMMLDKYWVANFPFVPYETNKKGAGMEIEFYFKFVLKPKAKKVTVTLEEQQ